EIMQKIYDKGFEGNLIFEGGNFVKNFQSSPFPYNLEAFGSSLYYHGNAPYWNQALFTYGNYFEGYGNLFPDQHFSLYGGGFSSLPTELGGQANVRGSRATGGTPLE
ncbi:MAG: hypothetical protein QXJ28_00830, partial [Candidatus Pacearchaeota archaeon]